LPALKDLLPILPRELLDRGVAAERPVRFVIYRCAVDMADAGLDPTENFEDRRDIAAERRPRQAILVSHLASIAEIARPRCGLSDPAVRAIRSL
jgi:hypothetical protein